MNRYFIKPGHWESATGESLPKTRDGIWVVPYEELQQAEAKERRIIELVQAEIDRLAHHGLTNEVIGEVVKTLESVLARIESA